MYFPGDFEVSWISLPDYEQTSSKMDTLVDVQGTIMHHPYVEGIIGVISP